jgi:hypothetical protein
MAIADDAIEIELTNSIIQQLIDGEDALSLRAKLEASLDSQVADRVFRSAFSQYSAAKEAGTLNDLQYDVAFSKRPAAASRQRAGLNVIALGIVLTAISYYCAVPGATYTVPVGTFAYGAWLLISD